MIKVKIMMELKNLLNKGTQKIELETENMDEMKILLDQVKGWELKMK